MSIRHVIVGVWIVMACASSLAVARPAAIQIDYPEHGTIFPPDFAAPTFVWRDGAENAAAWLVEVTFGDRSPGIRVEIPGERLAPGPVDPRAIAETNAPPRLTPEQANTRTWKPDGETWAEIRKRSARRPATVTITGYRDKSLGGAPVSRGSVAIQTSRDPVGAPIFYRDVPLMPSELEKGVIKPLAPAAVPLIAWRLRDVSESRSRLLMEGLHTCANCHSFSRDGKTMGMDLDGPQNDKGLYAVVPVQPQMTIRSQDVVKWSSFRSNAVPDLRVGFMSQVSPLGDYIVTMIDPPAVDASSPTRQSRRRAGRGRGHFYVANFKDYRFLQVFYPTRGILAWYSRATGRLQPLPGADDPRFVHTSAVWSPDGKYLVFARAEAREPYPEGRKLAEYANDPNETPIQYDLYRIPFNDGRGGVTAPIPGASANGMSNAFPKVSPDGRWIVFVKCRNGLLMRPDSQLFIVPANGGQARRMRANLPLMNSWHSFSPNGRWLVFSSKSRSPYTQMFLTHIDQDGRDSPAILIEDATQANRAVNIPEFVNIPPGGLARIDTPAVEHYKQLDRAFELAKKGQHEAAVAEWKKALALDGGDSKIHMNLGVSLAATGRLDEAIQSYQAALGIDPDDPEIRLNFGVALAGAGRFDEAIAQYRKSLDLDPNYPEAHNNLGLALARGGDLDQAIAHYRKALDINPQYAAIHNNLGAALARLGKLDDAIAHFQKYLEIDPGSVEVHRNLVRVLAQAGRSAEAVGCFENLLRIHPNSAALHNTLGLALVWQNRTGEAIARFNRALEIDPNLIEAHENLGDALLTFQGDAAGALAHWRVVLGAAPNHVPVLNRAALVLATDPDDSIRNGREAVRLAEQAVQLSGARDPAILDTLAAAYAEAGRFAEAVDTARRALSLAVAQGRQPLVAGLTRRISLYEANTPYRRQ
jgi:tetratricopeptide (TPR) repeat protein